MTPTKNDQAKAKEERLLDKSLEDTFPASDPSSVTRAPKDRRETPEAPPKAKPGETPKPKD